MTETLGQPDIGSRLMMALQRVFGFLGKAGDALRALSKLGVQIKVLTGDSERVTRHIYQALNLPVQGVVLGSEIESLDDLALQAKVSNANLFCRLNPAQKSRMIAALKARGHLPAEERAEDLLHRGPAPRGGPHPRRHRHVGRPGPVENERAHPIRVLTCVAVADARAVAHAPVGPLRHAELASQCIEITDDVLSAEVRGDIAIGLEALAVGRRILTEELLGDRRPVDRAGRGEVRPIVRRGIRSPWRGSWSLRGDLRR